MIVKSKSLKSRNSIPRVIRYVLGEEEHTIGLKYFHNFRANGNDIKEVIEEMEENDTLYRKRGSVKVYHDIISFSPKDKDILLQNPSIQQDILLKFISMRADRAKVIAAVHMEKNHIHLHCAISGILYRQSKSSRISKAEFLSIRKELERYQIQHYPELEHSLCYLSEKEKEQMLKTEFPEPDLSEGEKQMKDRTKKLTTKEIVSQKLQSIYLESNGQDDFFSRLIEQGFTLYKYRNKVNGLLYEGKKYRFRTLTVTDEHIRLLEQNYDRMKELESIQARNSRTQVRER